MEGITINTARSLLGRNVNVHLRDGSVTVNVLLAGIQKDEFERKPLFRCIPYGRRDMLNISLKSMAWAELLRLRLIMTGDKHPTFST